MPDLSDEFNEVSGTNGIIGAADSIILLRRRRGTKEVVLSCTSRDAEELRLSLNVDFETGAWTVVDKDYQEPMTAERSQILEVMKQAQKPMTPKEISFRIDKDAKTISALLSKMESTGNVVKGLKYGSWLPIKPGTGQSQTRAVITTLKPADSVA